MLREGGRERTVQLLLPRLEVLRGALQLIREPRVARLEELALPRVRLIVGQRCGRGGVGTHRTKGASRVVGGATRGLGYTARRIVCIFSIERFLGLVGRRAGGAHGRLARLKGFLG